MQLADAHGFILLFKVLCQPWRLLIMSMNIKYPKNELLHKPIAYCSIADVFHRHFLTFDQSIDAKLMLCNTVNFEQ